jgi:hypothetical protein
MRLAAGLLAAFFASSAAHAEIVGAEFADPTPRYDHAVLGDALEWGTLRLRLKDGRHLALTLPKTRVFEDTAPRLADLDGDGAPEVIVVETDMRRGAQLAVYGEAGKIAATSFIGQTHRWLAPIGADDLDGDGLTEIAYIETPHLGKRLKVFRLEGDRLVLIAQARGLTNHKIGDPFIQGGIAVCAGRKTILTANANWTRIIATTLQGGKLRAHDLAPYDGPDSFGRLKTCG